MDWGHGLKGFLGARNLGRIKEYSGWEQNKRQLRRGNRSSFYAK
jgi:hypothetical protein